MRLLVMSDLHCEFAPLNEQLLPDESEYDVVILAGDIHSRARSSSWASRMFSKPVVLIAGNHECYGGAVQQARRHLQRDAKPHVNFLEKATLNFGTTRILGCTGWTDFEGAGEPHLAMMQARALMNDYTQIRYKPGFRKITALDIRELARMDKAWLLDELAKPHEGITIVVSHYPPLLKFVPDFGYPNIPPSIFGNQWPEIFDYHIDLWIFGHTHSPVDETLNGVRFLSNPRGYPHEELPFNSRLIVEI